MMTAELPGSKEYCCFLTLSLSHPLSDSLSQSHLHAHPHTRTHTPMFIIRHYRISATFLKSKSGKKLQQKSFFCGSFCFFGLKSLLQLQLHFLMTHFLPLILLQHQFTLESTKPVSLAERQAPFA